MAKRICSIEDCGKPAHARGWCPMHYQRWRTHGDPTVSMFNPQPNFCMDCDVQITRTATRCRACNLRNVAKSRPPRRYTDAEKSKRWRERHPERQKATRRRAGLKRYGITEADYDRMLAEQGGRCAVCRSDDPAHPTGTWSVDHCHDTGRVRGLLCNTCNRVLGLFGDDPDVLMAAVAYVLASRDVLGVG